jgi:hypothetical protein
MLWNRLTLAALATGISALAALTTGISVPSTPHVGTLPGVVSYRLEHVPRTWPILDKRTNTEIPLTSVKSASYVVRRTLAISAL